MGNNKFMVFVKVNKKILVVGVGENVNKISEIEEETQVLELEKSFKKKSKNFAEILKAK